MASSRCPGKALAPLAGRPLLEVLLERMAAVRGVDGVVLATSRARRTTRSCEVARGAGVRGLPRRRGRRPAPARRLRARRGRGPRGARDRRQPAHRRGDDRSSSSRCTSREGAGLHLRARRRAAHGHPVRGRLAPPRSSGARGARRRAPSLGADDALHQGAPGGVHDRDRGSCPPGSTGRSTASPWTRPRTCG